MPKGLIVAKTLEWRQNSAKYLVTMKLLCVPIINLYIESKIYLLHDNCSMHVFGQYMDFFKMQDFELIEFPSKSRDINLMENIWKMMSDHIFSSNQPRNTKDLQQKICEAVYQINTEKRYIYSVFVLCLS